MELNPTLSRLLPGHEGRVAKKRAEEERQAKEYKETLKKSEALLFALKADIQDVGHELADALRQTHGKAHDRAYLKQSQAVFEAAVARLTDVDKELVHALKSKLDFLCLDGYDLGYTKPDEIEEDSLREAFPPSARGLSPRERQHEAQGIHGARIEMLREQGYDDKALARPLNEGVYKPHEGVDAAIQSLAEESLEAAQQFRGIEDDTLEEVLLRTEAALKHPSIQPHIEHEVDPIRFGVREIVARALHEHVERLALRGQGTVTEQHSLPSFYDWRKLLDRREHLSEIEAQLNDDEDLKNRAKFQQNEAQQEVQRLQNFDTLLTEMERYATRGALPDTEGADISVFSWQWPDEMRTQKPEDLFGAVRTLVQSIPQKNMQQLLRLRKQDLQTLLRTWAKTPNDNRGEFAQAFLHIIDTFQHDWHRSYHGRDRLHFLQSDVKENTVTAKIEAKKPRSAFEKNIRRTLEQARQKDLEHLNTLEDLEDLASYLDIQEQLAQIGERLDMQAQVEETQKIIDRITNVIRDTIADIQRNPMAHARGSHEEKLRLEAWLTRHPMGSDLQQNDVRRAA